MNYQILTGLTALVATVTLPTVAFATGAISPTQPSAPIESKQLIAQSVVRASFYGNAPGEGGPWTANGELYNPGGYTAAHKTLPFGTKMRVTGANGRSVIVRINDRGPFIPGRVLDLSVGAARAIGLTSTGIGNVRMDILSMGNGATFHNQARRQARRQVRRSNRQYASNSRRQWISSIR